MIQKLLWWVYQGGGVKHDFNSVRVTQIKTLLGSLCGVSSSQLSHLGSTLPSQMMMPLVLDPVCNIINRFSKVCVKMGVELLLPCRSVYWWVLKCCCHVDQYIITEMISKLKLFLLKTPFISDIVTWIIISIEHMYFYICSEE